MRIEDIPLNDPKTYDLLASGLTLGVFQLDSPGMQGLLKQVRPSSLNDISAVLALYRPGPMDNRSHIEYAKRKSKGLNRAQVHPELNDLLSDALQETYGLIVYQEQVLHIINAVTGWDYAEAEGIFTAMRKKKIEAMEAAKPAFFEAASVHGYSSEAVQVLWDTLVPFSDYSFNKAHSIAYAHISYWTAYLKANHPVEYMAALLSGEADDPEKLHQYLMEAQRMGIPLLSPDVNESGLSFTPTSKGIRYGIAAIKGVGESATSALLAGRPYTSCDDFFRRADAKVLNAGVFQALGESGALDSLWSEREALLAEGPGLAALALERRKVRARGSAPLIPDRFEPCPGTTGGADPQARQAWEEARLGAVFTHPTVRLVVNRELTDQEATWLGRQLIARRGMSPVSLVSKGIAIPLSMTVDSRGLAEALAKIGVQVES